MPLPQGSRLNVTVFGPGLERAKKALRDLGAQVLGQSPSPFGPQLVIRPGAWTLGALAGLPEVQRIETYAERVLLNDLSRVRLGMASNLTTPRNVLGLTGEGIVVNVNDSGVDGAHPDLVGRVFSGFPAVSTDADGHGTHVAGTIASSGINSSGTVAGSPSNANFRGMAPGARLYGLAVDLVSGPLLSDGWLQEAAASNYYLKLGKTNAHLSNNSWGYSAVNEYNMAAASYDAAVRDALPGVSGAQAVLYVFAAGNEGFGRQDGSGGVPNSILSPATAKNVITVGAIENFRSLSNAIVVTNVTSEAAGNSVTNVTTNQIFLASTDSPTEVANFSSRGNVGIGVEGEFGRFKPDVMAPGTFVVSTRAQRWIDPSRFTNVQANTVKGLVVNPGAATDNALVVPDNAVQFTIRVLANVKSPHPFPGLSIYARFGQRPDASDLVGTNQVSIPPSRPLRAGVWYYRISNPGSRPVNYDLQTLIVLTNASAEYFAQLKKLNAGLAPHYRLESGTSMAAAAVSGTLALVAQYLEGQGLAYSPALLKALLINGARSVGPLYDLQVNSPINFQGWGAVNLAHTLPAAPLNGGALSGPVRFIDQSVSHALATGQSNCWSLSLSSNATAYPLRVTLVWSDPPGNPNAAVKLVNDLDLVVSDRDSGQVYYGNNILAGTDYTAATATNQPPANDLVNNVENVFLAAPLGTNYSITVYARRVNVNAVSDHPEGIVQDYALVVSSENSALTNAFSLVPVGPESAAAVPLVNTLTNGLPRLNQRVGANSPLVGSANGTAQQWNFYVFTNNFNAKNELSITNGTNVAFLTFVPPNLARPRNEEADVDLYVSSDAGLVNLDANVIARAFKSRNRGGTELIVFSNSFDGQVFYVGVKSEDQQGAEYGLVGLSSNVPFDQDRNGDRVLQGLPLNAVIPDGSPEKPGGVYVFAIATRAFQVQNVIVENLTITHENFGDLLGNLSHNGRFVVLNNHGPADLGGTLRLVYDDQRLTAGSLSPDGPGSLNNFVGETSSGLWLLTMVDNSLNHTGRVNNLQIVLQPANTNGLALFGRATPNQFAYFSVEVPSEATNLSVTLSAINPSAPLDLYLRRNAQPSRTRYDKFALISPPGGSLSLSTNDLPPLNAGRYFIGVFNPNSVTVNFRLTISIGRSLTPKATVDFLSGDTPLSLLDDAVTRSRVYVPIDREVMEVQVGVQIDHPRASDLVLHLVSPQGTRILLAENRGRTNALGYGASDFLLTNTAAILTNSFENAAPTNYFVGDTVDGWRVVENVVSVRDEPALAANGTKTLVLRGGRISQVLPTTTGRSYQLSFAYRLNPGVPRGIMGWWPVVGRSATDIAGGSTGIMSDVTVVPGMVDEAFGFDGATSLLSVPDAPTLHFVGDYTAEFWVKPDSVQNPFANILRKEDPLGTNGFGIEMDGLTNSNFYYAGWKNNRSTPGNECWTTAGFRLIPEIWQHVAIVKTNATRLVYVNGALVSSATCVGTTNTAAIEPNARNGARVLLVAVTTVPL